MDKANEKGCVDNQAHYWYLPIDDEEYCMTCLDKRFSPGKHTPLIEEIIVEQACREINKKLVIEYDKCQKTMAEIIYSLAGEANSKAQKEAFKNLMVKMTVNKQFGEKALRSIGLK